MANTGGVPRSMNGDSFCREVCKTAGMAVVPSVAGTRGTLIGVVATPERAHGVVVAGRG